MFKNALVTFCEGGACRWACVGNHAIIGLFESVNAFASGAEGAARTGCATTAVTIVQVTVAHACQGCSSAGA